MSTDYDSSIPTKYLNFASAPNEHVRFYVGCPIDHSESQLIIANHHPLPKNVFETALYSETEYMQGCWRINRTENVYDPWVPIDSSAQPSGFYYAKPLHIRSEHNAVILFAQQKEPNFDTDDLIDIGMSNYRSFFFLLFLHVYSIPPFS